MLLCIDCGNTRVKWGLHDGNHWMTREALPLGELERLGPAFSRLPPPNRVLACSVAGKAADREVEAAVHALGLPLTWLVSRQSQCGVTNTYADPEQLGPDRWAALIGARQLIQDDCLVVNAGTATTIDVLDRNGVFQGGLILPGIELMRASLANNTARLALADGHYQLLPRNTADAIASGALQATAGAIARMFSPIATFPGASCLISGGAAPLLLPLLNIPWRTVDHLVLEGLFQVGTAGL